MDTLIAGIHNNNIAHLRLNITHVCSTKRLLLPYYQEHWHNIACLRLYNYTKDIGIILPIGDYISMARA